MSKVIDIEYCGSWGYGGPAMRLKKYLVEKFPGVEINNHSAKGTTGVIQVSWIVDGKKSVVWSKGKGET